MTRAIFVFVDEGSSDLSKLCFRVKHTKHNPYIISSQIAGGFASLASMGFTVLA